MRNKIALGLTALAVAFGVATVWGMRAPTRIALVQTLPGPPAGYDLVPAFADEFNGTKLDTRTWINVYAPRDLRDPPIVKRSLWGNGELQVYFDKEYLGLGIDPFRVADGLLTITAQPLSPSSHAAVMNDLSHQRADFQRSALNKVAYSSGLISTRDGFKQKYGYFEIRARWTGGRGLWPCFWLLPEDGGWPPEIDVMEAHGDKPDTAFQSIHSNLDPKATTRTVDVDGSTAEFHSYGALWLPDRVDYYIDGEKTASIPTPADMNQKMYILANLGVGGYWPGYPGADVKFPATMDIDYIRVWRFRNAPPGPGGS